MGAEAHVKPCGNDTSSPQRPSHSLQRRLVLWTAILVVVPMFVCAVWLNHIARESLHTIHQHTLELLSQTVSASLSDRLADGWSRDAQTVIDGLCLDPRVALVMVTDPAGRVIHRRSADAQAWVAISEMADQFELSSIELDQSLSLSEDGELVARKVPIWNPPVRENQLDAQATVHRQLQGYVLIALRDKHMPQVLDSLALAQLGATCLMGLVMLPLVVWAVRRWLVPVRALLGATMQLAEGKLPQRVVATADDELGMLTNAFNTMAQRLVAAHKQLQQANEQLEEKVALRTNELQQVNGKLENQIKDKNEFIRAVTHDLGAPVRNIAGMAQMLLRKYEAEFADDARNKLQRIRANAKLQTDLIGDLLELSRIQTRPGRKENVDLHELVLDLAQSLEYDLERSGIEFSITGRLPVIHAQRNRMRQIFQNLLDNAVKYTLDSPTPGSPGSPDSPDSPGSPDRRRINVAVTQSETAYQFGISDTGCGIAQEDLAGIFQVFARSTHSDSHHVPGRGVGLASVKSIVETYGGEIWVTSKLKEGSTFYFTLALNKVNLPQETAAA